LSRGIGWYDVQPCNTSKTITMKLEQGWHTAGK
jgi:hypothetical protein